MGRITNYRTPPKPMTGETRTEDEDESYMNQLEKNLSFVRPGDTMETNTMR